MNVGDLIAALQTFDADDVVVLMNEHGASPLSGVEDATYLPDSTWGGEIKYRRLDDELRDQGYGEEDVVAPDGECALACAVLWPVN